MSEHSRALPALQVKVEEREPPLVLKEQAVMEALPETPAQRSPNGCNLTGASANVLLSRFAEAAVPQQMQPYRFLATELGGVVFTCSNEKVRECLDRQLFGMMQNAFVPIVQHIRPGMPVCSSTNLLMPCPCNEYCKSIYGLQICIRDGVCHPACLRIPQFAG